MLRKNNYNYLKENIPDFSIRYVLNWGLNGLHFTNQVLVEARGKASRPWTTMYNRDRNHSSNMEILITLCS